MGEPRGALHPDKTRIIYCKDGHRRGSHEHTSFTFLGYTFRARKNRSRHGNLFLSFDPAVSKDALKKMGREVRSWHLHTRSDLSFQELARRINPDSSSSSGTSLLAARRKAARGLMDPVLTPHCLAGTPPHQRSGLPADQQGHGLTTEVECFRRLECSPAGGYDTESHRPGKSH